MTGFCVWEYQHSQDSTALILCLPMCSASLLTHKSDSITSKYFSV